MKNNRISSLVISALISCLCLSCVGIENGDNGSRGSGNICIRINNAPVQTKALATAGTSYVALYNEDGTENKDFVLECLTVPTGEDAGAEGTKAALYGSGIRQGSSGMEEGRYHYYEYKSPIVLTGNCYNNKEKKNTTVYYQEHVAYNEERDLWIPGDGRIWMDYERYEFRAHLPETLNGVDNLTSFDASLSFDYTIPESSADQQDIMFGYFPFGDRTRQKSGYKVADIPFKHALASVRFMAYLTDGGSSGARPNLGIRSISLADVYEKGRCSQDGGDDFQWTALTEDGYEAGEYYGDAAKTTVIGQSDYAFDLTAGQYTDIGYDEEDGNDFVFTVMPQDLHDDPVELVLECISNYEDLTFRATIRTGEWKAGYTTIYRLMPNIICGYVDLGLSVIWGDHNIGAFKHLERGWPIRWGETNLDSEKPYKYSDDHGNMTKYNGSDGLTVLQPQDDAATHYNGEPWRTPTIDECMELDNIAWIDKYGSSSDLNNMFISKFAAPYEGNKIMIPASQANERDIMTSSLSLDDNKDYYYLYGWIDSNYDPGYITQEWDGRNIRYTYLGTVRPNPQERAVFPQYVRPVIPVLIFNGYEAVRPNNIITASAGSSVSFTLAEEYEDQTWSAEANGAVFDTGTGSDSITIPSGATKVVLKRDTGVVIGTINVE